MKPQIEVVIVNQNGWWSVVCTELGISGFGESEQEAIKAFERSLISSVMAKLRIVDESSVEVSVGCRENSTGAAPYRTERRVPISQLVEA